MKAKKLLATLLTVSVLLGTPVTALATTPADQKYGEAYTAVVKAKTLRTQDAINEARVAIRNLKGSGAEFAIGEFSKQVDSPQQDIFVFIVNTLVTETPKQKELTGVVNYLDQLRNNEDAKQYESTWRNVCNDKQEKLLKYLENKTSQKADPSIKAEISEHMQSLKESYPKDPNYPNYSRVQKIVNNYEEKYSKIAEPEKPTVDWSKPFAVTEAKKTTTGFILKFNQPVSEVTYNRPITVRADKYDISVGIYSEDISLVDPFTIEYKLTKDSYMGRPGQYYNKEKIISEAEYIILSQLGNAGNKPIANTNYYFK